MIPRERLVAYLLGDLSPRAAGAVARAERENAAVRTELATLRQVLAALQEAGAPLPDAPPDPRLTASTLEKIRAVAAEPTLTGRTLGGQARVRPVADHTLTAPALPQSAPPRAPRWLLPAAVAGLAVAAVTLAVLSVPLPLPTTPPEPKEAAALAAPPVPPVPELREDLGPADPFVATDRALAAYQAPLLGVFARDGAFPAALRGVLPLAIVPLDGWGQTLWYLASPDRRRAWVVSPGPDGQLDTPDDRTLDVLERRVELGPAPPAALRPGRLAAPDPD